MAYSLLFLRSRFPVLSTSGTAILTAAVILAGSGGCLYTDPINRPPTITIVQLMTEIFRGEDAVFQADASDPEGDLSTVEWVRDDARACPRGPRDHLDRKNWPVGVRHAGRIFEVAGQDTEAPFCLWAFATDAEGAVTAAEPLQVNPKSHAPVAKIEVIDPVDPSAYSMYADVKLSAHGSTADALATPTWKVVAPPGSSVMDLECSSELDPQIACLTPDIPGKYLIELTVRNPDGAMSMTSLPVQVLPDRLPCIANLAPAALEFPQDPNESTRRLSVGADDDGDPFPSPDPMSTRLQRPEFRWFRGTGSQKPEIIAGNDLPDYYLPVNRFFSGERVTIRVEVRDRNTTAIDALLSACGDQPTCAGDPRRPMCLQRVSWTINFL